MADFQACLKDVLSNEDSANDIMQGMSAMMSALGNLDPNGEKSKDGSSEPTPEELSKLMKDLMQGGFMDENLGEKDQANQSTKPAAKSPKTTQPTAQSQ